MGVAISPAFNSYHYTRAAYVDWMEKLIQWLGYRMVCTHCTQAIRKQDHIQSRVRHCPRSCFEVVGYGGGHYLGIPLADTQIERPGMKWR